MSQRKTRWGVLSTAYIATAKVIPALAQTDSCEVVAIASRTKDKAEAAAARLGIPRAYGSYEELLADPEVDVIYNPTPNHLHVPLSIAALEAGKHVLCEKPIGLSAAEGQQLVEAGRKHPELKLMEAFMYRHHPQWRRALELVHSGDLGEVRTIQSFFSYFSDDPSNIKNVPEYGGGSLFDIGCYNISLSRFLFDAEPERVYGVVEYDPRLGVDRLATGLLQFGSRTSGFACSTQLNPYQRVNVFGTGGRVEIEIPFNAPPDVPCRMWIQRGDEIETVSIGVCDQYAIQGDLFARAILDDTPVPTPIEDAVQNMKVIEAVIESGRRGTPVELTI
jgi:predicted dehydrogenase